MIDAANAAQKTQEQPFNPEDYELAKKMPASEVREDDYLPALNIVVKELMNDGDSYYFAYSNEDSNGRIMVTGSNIIEVCRKKKPAPPTE